MLLEILAELLNMEFIDQEVQIRISPMRPLKELGREVPIGQCVVYCHLGSQGFRIVDISAKLSISALLCLA